MNVTDPQARTVGVVVPVYNEQACLPQLFARLEALQVALPRLTEVLFVDDGSTDGSFALLLEACRSRPGWRVIRLSRNFGQEAAMLAGLQHVTTEAVVLLDADLQDPPEVIPRMVALWDEGWDVVYGVRERRLGEGWGKRLSAKLFYRLLRWLSDVEIPVDAGDFRLIDRRVVEVLNRMGEHRPYLRGLVSWVGFRQTGLPFERQPRTSGCTKYDLTRMLHLSIDAIIGFSAAPLRVVTRLGVLAVLFALFYGLVVLGLWIADINVPGWTSMMLVILLLGAMQLIALGLIGEYLANVSMEVKDRPRYVIAFDSGEQVPRKPPIASRPSPTEADRP